MTKKEFVPVAERPRTEAERRADDVLVRVRRASGIATRTAAATAAASRAALERRADYLRQRGWVCIPPEAAGTYGPPPSTARRVEFGEPTDGGCE